MFYLFGFSLGYLVSVLVPMRYTAVVGVMVAMIFCLNLAGINPTAKEVNAKSAGQKGLYYLSAPFWLVEAFYLNSVSYNQFIPDKALVCRSTLLEYIRTVK